jgi:ribosome biogenesis GTPase
LHDARQLGDTGKGPVGNDPVSIVAVLPRRSANVRGGAGAGATEQVLAANIDVVWMVQGLDTPPNWRRIERYLVVAWESGVVLTPQAGRTIALLGPSGAGKSTLINALAEEALAATATVRESDRMGRHHDAPRARDMSLPGLSA